MSFPFAAHVRGQAGLSGLCEGGQVGPSRLQAGGIGLVRRICAQETRLIFRALRAESEVGPVSLPEGHQAGLSRLLAFIKVVIVSCNPF